MKPDWLQHPGLESALKGIVRQLDRQPAELRQNAIYIRTNHKHLNALTEPAYPGEEQVLWRQIENAINDGVFELVEGSRRHWEPAYINARLRFCFPAESRVRDWLGMPHLPTCSPWANALDALGGSLSVDVLAPKPLNVPGHSEEEVVMQLLAMQSAIAVAPGRYTLRQLAARFLWGASKALDGRGETWVESALGVGEGTILQRPIHALVHAGQGGDSKLLFVENKDTFDLLVRSAPSSFPYSVVYLSGFQGAAHRIRSTSSVTLFFSSQTDPTVVSMVKQLWFDQPACKAFVWTDLDYSGLQIAISLRKSFPALDWFKPGYDAMIGHLVSGYAHGTEHTSKGDQSRPSEEVLWGRGREYLAAIEQSGGGFVDQEAVEIEALFEPNFSE